MGNFISFHKVLANIRFNVLRIVGSSIRWCCWLAYKKGNSTKTRLSAPNTALYFWHGTFKSRVSEIIYLDIYRVRVFFRGCFMVFRGLSCILIAFGSDSASSLDRIFKTRANFSRLSKCNIYLERYAHLNHQSWEWSWDNRKII